LDILFGRDIVEVQLARAERLGHVHYEPGDVIAHQGQAADLFYVVVDGEVEIVREHVEGGETLVARLGPGEHFGEMALLHNSMSRSATVRAATACNLLTLGRDDFTLLTKKWTGLRETVQEAMRARE
jgi:CRP-like cAMP-binding protein